MSSMEESKQSTSNQSTAKQEFFQWAMKWNYGNLAEDTSTAPDLPSLINLMQIAGFKMRKFDKFDGFYNFEPLDPKSVRVTIECGNSHMMAVLEMNSVQCSCPETSSSDSDGSFWSVSTNGHWGSVDNINAVCGFGSTLLPVVSTDTTSVLRDVIYRLFKMLNDKNSPPEKSKNQPILNRSNSELNLTYRRSDDEPISSNLTKREFSSTQNLARLSLPVSMSLPGNNTFDGQSRIESSMESMTSLAAQRSRMRLNRQETYNVTGKLDNKLPKSNDSDLSHKELANYVRQAHGALEQAMKLINKEPTREASKTTKTGIKYIKPTSPDLNGSFVISTPRRTSSTLSRRNSTSNSSLASSHDSRSTATSRLPPRPSTTKSSHLARRSVTSTACRLPTPKISSRLSSGNTTFRKQDETSSASSLASASNFSQLRRQSLNSTESSKIPMVSRSNSLKSDKQSPVTSANTRGQTGSPATGQSLIKPPGRISDSLVSRFGYMGLSRKS